MLKQRSQIQKLALSRARRTRSRGPLSTLLSERYLLYPPVMRLGLPALIAAVLFSSLSTSTTWAGAVQCHELFSPAIVIKSVRIVPDVDILSFLKSWRIKPGDRATLTRPFSGRLGDFVAFKDSKLHRTNSFFAPDELPVTFEIVAFDGNLVKMTDPVGRVLTFRVSASESLSLEYVGAEAPMEPLSNPVAIVRSSAIQSARTDLKERQKIARILAEAQIPKSATLKANENAVSDLARAYEFTIEFTGRRQRLTVETILELSALANASTPLQERFVTGLLRGTKGFVEVENERRFVDITEQQVGQFSTAYGVKHLQYAHPTAAQVSGLMRSWMRRANSRERLSRDEAVELAEEFVRIHPLGNANGRLGRLLLDTLLLKNGYELYGHAWYPSPET